MEQRPLRLGDIVDDYCPRERRLTNHAIVAIVEQTIRQTRCTTCDTEHVYKDGRLPRRRKGSDGEDLTDLSGGQLRRPAPIEPEPASPAMAAAPESLDASVVTPPVQASPVVGSGTDVGSATEEDEVVRNDDGGNDIWPAHRQLIRAQLPRTEGEPPPARPIPEFTMHQRQGRGGHGYRQGPSWHGGNGQSRNGFRPERNGNVGEPPRGSGGGGAGRPGRHRGRGRRSR
jgi:hypothetical protein